MAFSPEKMLVNGGEDKPLILSDQDILQETSQNTEKIRRTGGRRLEQSFGMEADNFRLDRLLLIPVIALIALVISAMVLETLDRLRDHANSQRKLRKIRL